MWCKFDRAQRFCGRADPQEKRVGVKIFMLDDLLCDVVTNEMLADENVTEREVDCRHAC